MAGDAWVKAALANVADQGRIRSLDARVIQSRTGRTVTVNGRTLICFASNDYLGLSADADVARAAADATLLDGSGSGASRHITGNLAVHKALEAALSAWTGAEASVLFGSGFLANVGIIRALVGPGDVVFSDELNHASLIDGCRQSRAEVHVYRHADMEHLASLLAAHPGRRRLVVTDGVFSMDGDVAPLRRLCDLADAHDAMTLVDEAHALGAVGPRGAGACVQAGVVDRVTVRMGTLGKALGSYGAFAVGKRTLVDLLVNTARTLIFSTALPAGASAAAMAALDKVLQGDRTARLQQRCAQLMRLLRSRGLERLLPAQLQGLETLPTPIVPMLIGDNMRALQVAQRMERDGLLCVGIRPPTVPEGTARLRITLCADHTEDDLALLVDALVRHLGEAPAQPVHP
jgi:8-amino-7-oxononanoate synthase